MMKGYRRWYIWVFIEELYCIGCGNVLHDYVEVRELCGQPSVYLQELSLSFHDKPIRFAMNEKRDL